MSECSVILGQQNPSEIKIRIPPDSGNGLFELRAFVQDGKFVLDVAAVATAVEGTKPQAYKQTGSYGPNRGIPEGPPVGYQLTAEEMAFCTEYRKNFKPEDVGVGVKWSDVNSMSDLHCDLQAAAPMSDLGRTLRTELAAMAADLYTKKVPDAEKVATVNKKRDDILKEIFG